MKKETFLFALLSHLEIEVGVGGGGGDIDKKGNTVEGKFCKEVRNKQNAVFKTFTVPDFTVMNVRIENFKFACSVFLCVNF
jgi:hypothetical protein